MRKVIGSMIACATLAACGSGGKASECKNSDDCNLEAGGECTTYAPTGNDWCTYPDTDCPSGRRWSDVATGDDLSGTCVDASGPDASMPDAAPDDAAGNIDAYVPVDAMPPADAAPPLAEQALRFGGIATDSASAVGIDGQGNVYLAGSFGGVTNFGNGNVSSAGVGDLFVASYNPAGTFRWVVTAGSGGAEGAKALAVDPNGDVVVVGTFENTINLAGQNLTSGGALDIFVAKLAGGNGARIWAKSFSATGNQDGNAVAVDQAGDVFIAGYYVQSVNLGGSNLPTAQGTGAFVAKLRGDNGAHVWSNGYGSSTSTVALDVEVDGAGNVGVVGYYGVGDASLGGATLTGAGGVDAFVAKYRGDTGGHLWSMGHGGSGNDSATGVGFASDGDVIVAGTFSNTVDFGGGARTSAGSRDAFIARFGSASGSHVWSARYGGTSGDDLNGTHVANGSIFVVGTFGGAVTFGGATFVADSTDGFVAKYDEQGAHEWSLAVGGSGADLGLDVVADPVNAWISGGFVGTASFGSVVLSSAGDKDIYVARLVPN